MLPREKVLRQWVVSGILNTYLIGLIRKTQIIQNALDLDEENAYPNLKLVRTVQNLIVIRTLYVSGHVDSGVG